MAYEGFTSENQPIRDGHPRQCKAIHKTLGKRCRKYAVQGSKYCASHGGKRLGRAGRPRKYTHGRFMSSAYLQCVGPTLKEKLTELLNKPHDEQVALYEELAVARAAAAQALKLASPIFEPKKSLTPEVATLAEDPQFKALALSTLKDAMTTVKDLVVAASKIEKDAEDKVSVKVINLFVIQILRAIESVLGADHDDLLRKIQKAIDEQVRMPLNDKQDAVINIEISPFTLPGAPKQVESHAT